MLRRLLVSKIPCQGARQPRTPGLLARKVAEGAEGGGGVFETAASISESEATSPRSVAIVA